MANKERIVFSGHHKWSKGDIVIWCNRCSLHKAAGDEDGRTCEEIVTQMAAVGKAINTAAFTLIAANLGECIEKDAANKEEVTLKLQKLFLSLA